MSIPQSAGGPIESRDDLVRHLSKGSRPRDQWLIGTEHEKFVYDLKTHKPVAYEGKPGIRQLLEGMQRFGWQPVLEGGNIIGLSQNGASLSLEPGGQFELSGAAVKTIHETCAETNLHLEQTREVANEIGVGVLGFGFAPNVHDVLTGSTMEGRAFPAGDDRTCGNWTSSTKGSAMLGHSDRTGLSDTVEARSWNAAHGSRGADGGCSQNDLRSTGGAGLFYCFAAN